VQCFRSLKSLRRLSTKSQRCEILACYFNIHLGLSSIEGKLNELNEYVPSELARADTKEYEILGNSNRDDNKLPEETSDILAGLSFCNIHNCS
jgi:hypothetical protein